MPTTRNTARCEAGHAIEKPNLVWELRQLDRYPATKTEVRTLRQWIPRCRACADPDLLLQQELLRDFAHTKGTAAYDDELARLTALDRRRAEHEAAQRSPSPEIRQGPQETRECGGGHEGHAHTTRGPGGLLVADETCLDRPRGLEQLVSGDGATVDWLRRTLGDTRRRRRSPHPTPPGGRSVMGQMSAGSGRWASTGVTCATAAFTNNGCLDPRRERPGPS